MKRRSFMAFSPAMIAALRSPVIIAAIGAGMKAEAQQNAVMEKGKAVVCETNTGTTHCPLNHETCFTIDAPLVIGTGTYQNPDVGQLSSKHVLECDVCHILFIKA